MTKRIIGLTTSLCLLAMLAGAGTLFAAKSGGILKPYHRGTPPSGSVHEEATNSTMMPYMGVFNNLIMFDWKEAIESADTIVPDLATEWSWGNGGKDLTFKLRKGVKWHDGKPFTSKDVKCTWELVLGKSRAKLRKNPRKSWYKNLDSISTNGDYEATFHLKRPQPAFIMLLASGYSAVYPCHVPPKTMRTNPIGTGPFKFVELKQNEHITFTKNKDYWKKGMPYLDGIEWTIIKNRSTRVLGFIAGKFDLSFVHDVSLPIYKDNEAALSKVNCQKATTNVSTNLIVNQSKPPFDNPKIRLAMMLAIDRKAFNDILWSGEAIIGGAMMPPPNGVWGMPPEVLKDVAGYGPDVKGNRDRARKIMQGLGYGPNKKLKVTISTRNIAIYRDPAAILIDHLKEIYFDAELKNIETSNWHATVARKDYQVGLNLTGIGVDEPDAQFFENYACGSQRNYTGYCNQEMEKLFVKQSMETNLDARKKLVWEIDKKLQEDAARPIIAHSVAYTCMQPFVKDYIVHKNSSYNSFRFEQVWLDK